MSHNIDENILLLIYLQYIIFKVTQNKIAIEKLIHPARR